MLQPLFSNGQHRGLDSKLMHKNIQGKWRTEQDRKSALIFDKDRMYQLYNDETIFTFKYYCLDSGALLLSVQEDNLDTTYYEVYNVSKSFLSMLNLTKAESIWVLKRDKSYK